MNTFKTVAKTHYPQNIAPLVDPPGGRGGYDFKKLNPHPNGIWIPSLSSILHNTPTPKNSPLPPPQESFPLGGWGGWLQKSKFAPKIGLHTKFQLNSSKYVVTTPPPSTEWQLRTLILLTPSFYPPPAIEMPPKKGGFRGSVEGEVVEMKRNIKIWNLVRKFHLKSCQVRI